MRDKLIQGRFTYVVSVFVQAASASEIVAAAEDRMGDAIPMGEANRKELRGGTVTTALMESQERTHEVYDSETEDEDTPSERRKLTLSQHKPSSSSFSRRNVDKKDNNISTRRAEEEDAGDEDVLSSSLDGLKGVTSSVESGLGELFEGVQKLLFEDGPELVVKTGIVDENSEHLHIYNMLIVVLLPIFAVISICVGLRYLRRKLRKPPLTKGEVTDKGVTTMRVVTDLSNPDTHESCEFDETHNFHQIMKKPNQFPPAHGSTATETSFCDGFPDAPLIQQQFGGNEAHLASKFDSQVPNTSISYSIAAQPLKSSTVARSDLEKITVDVAELENDMENGVVSTEIRKINSKESGISLVSILKKDDNLSEPGSIHSVHFKGEKWSFKNPVERHRGSSVFIDSRPSTPGTNLFEKRETIGGSSSSSSCVNTENKRRKLINSKQSGSSESEPDAEPSNSPAIKRNTFNTAPIDLEKYPRCIAFLFASPLVYRNYTEKTIEAPMLPSQLNVEEEWTGLENSVKDAKIAVLPCAATIQSMQQICVQNKGRVLHVAAHGIRVENETRLMLEDGKGAGVLVDDAMVKRLLGSAAPALVFLNICASDKLAESFLKAGARHVVCASGEVGDGTSKVFVKSFYKSLATGRNVRESFEFAQAAFEIEVYNSNQQNNNKPFTNFLLRSQANYVDTQLFPMLSGSISNCITPQISTRSEGVTDYAPEIEYASSTDALMQLPPIPEDFVGRTLDVWAVIQHLERRRLVVVSAEANSEHGIGLTSVCEVATRFLHLRSFCGVKGSAMFNKVQRIYLNSLTDGKTNWVERLRRSLGSRLHASSSYMKRSDELYSYTPESEPTLQNYNSLRSSSTRYSSEEEKTRGSNSRESDPKLPILSRAVHLFPPPAKSSSSDSDMADIESNADSHCSDRRSSVDIEDLEMPISRHSPFLEAHAAPRQKKSVNQLALLCMDLQRLSENEKMLVVLDECDHVIQQDYFQDGLQCLLKDCPNISFLINTHQPVMGRLQGFKNVHVTLKALSDEDSGKLFLRRLSQLITWRHLGYADDREIRLSGDVTMIYRRVGRSPFLQPLGGHPRLIIEAAMELL